jgi:hypothetical protein
MILSPSEKICVSEASPTYTKAAKIIAEKEQPRNAKNWYDQSNTEGTCWQFGDCEANIKKINNNIGCDADNKLAKHLAIYGTRQDRAIKSKMNFRKNNLKYWVGEELDEAEKRVWWEREVQHPTLEF